MAFLILMYFICNFEPIEKAHPMFLKRIAFILVSISFVLCTKAQVTSTNSAIPETAKTAMGRLTEQIRSFPQEKIYLHLDKPYYSAGERVWLRAHMVHATLNIPLNISRYIYVELIDAKNTVVLRKKIHRVEKDEYFGQFDLSPDTEAGWYTIRAYTNFMRNIPAEFYFNKQVYITNNLADDAKKTAPKTGTIKPSPAKTSKPATTKNTFDVQFFPEGGHLIADSYQVLGFKAIGTNGLGVDIQGVVVDQTGKEVVKFKSSNFGMGKFLFNHQTGKTYKAICTASNGHKTTVVLPTASKNDLSLSIQQSASRINIQVVSPEQKTRKGTYYLIGCMRGLPVFQSTLTPESQGYVYPKQGLNSGIMQIYLIDNTYSILSERNIFIMGKDNAGLSIMTDKTSYTKRSSVHAQLQLKDAQGNPVLGNFSLSVTNDNDIRLDSTESTIKSYLLLQSDIKGFIEKPGSYFNTSNKNAEQQLDALMLTQGWARYDASSVLKGHLASCDSFEIEQGPVVSGNVRTFPNRRPLANHNVSLLLYGRKIFFDGIRTDKNGNFSFLCPNYPEDTKIRLEASRSETQSIELFVRPDTFPKVPDLSAMLPALAPKDKQMQSFLAKSKEHWSYENGSYSIDLEDIEITAQKADPSEKVRKDRGAIYSDPSYSMDETSLKEYTTIMDALCMAPGISPDPSGSGILLRNAKPLIIVDQMEYSMEELANIRIDDVQMFDILRDFTQTNLYGSKGNNGVVVIYLKRGSDTKREENDLALNQSILKPLGYTQPAEFYRPKYEVESIRLDSKPDLRTTIYWQPVVKTNEKGEADVFFFTSDGQGTYTITAEGVTPKGELIRAQSKITCK